MSWIIHRLLCWSTKTFQGREWIPVMHLSWFVTTPPNPPPPPRPRGGRGIAVEMSIALTKVLPRQCGGDTRGYRHKGPWNEKIAGCRRKQQWFFLQTSSFGRVGLLAGFCGTKSPRYSLGLGGRGGGVGYKWLVHKLGYMAVCMQCWLSDTVNYPVPGHFFFEVVSR